MPPVRMDFSLEGDERLRKALGRAVKPGADPALRRGLRRGALLVEAKAKELVSGKLLNVRSGRGRASITADTSGLPDFVDVGSPLVYMATLEGTGQVTIRPNSAQVLTIPLPAALTAKGVQRFSAREAASRFEDTFWQRSRKGNLILFGKTGEELTPLFVGKQSVSLRRRPWLSRAFDDSLARIADLLATEIEEAL